MYTALASLDGVLTVFEHYDATLVSGPVHTAGTWDYAPSYSSGTGLTTFTSGTSVFEDHMVGWFLQPDGRSATYFPIVDVTATTLVVAGNVSTLAGIGDVYFIVPPVGVDRDTGTFNGLKGGFFGGDQNLTRGTFIRNLAWGYRYIPPAVGILDNSTVYGRQPGDNLAGQYSVWHRVYDPVQGRWTTPDPVEETWWNKLDYVRSAPIGWCDPTGLNVLAGKTDKEVYDYLDTVATLWWVAGLNLAASALANWLSGTGAPLQVSWSSLEANSNFSNAADGIRDSVVAGALAQARLLECNETATFNRKGKVPVNTKPSNFQLAAAVANPFGNATAQVDVYLLLGKVDINYTASGTVSKVCETKAWYEVWIRSCTVSYRITLTMWLQDKYDFENTRTYSLLFWDALGKDINRAKSVGARDFTVTSSTTEVLMDWEGC
jgi:RHS repeat-associated protein